MVPAIDISKYQGAWQDYPALIVMVKMSGGDDGLYMDSQATSNYNGAVADGKAVGGYHFIGWTIGAAAEANYFLQAMSPVAENDVYALDIEAIKTTDPVSYVQVMVNTIHNAINVWPLVYMNLATLNAYAWGNILQTCGLWLADWNNDPNGTIPTLHTYVMQQYSDGPNYDHDEWFGTVAQFQKYGYHAPVTPPPVPIPPAPIPPDPVPIPVPPTPTPTPPPVIVVTPPQSWWKRLITWLKYLFS